MNRQGAWLENSNWYLCFTKPRQELLAADKLQQQGYQVQLPLMGLWQRSRGQWQLLQKPMFPRYAFVRPGKPGQSIAPSQYTPGVSHLVRFGAVLATLDHRRVASVMALAAATARRQPLQTLETGTEVLFACGPLKGCEGIVSSVAGERVNVLLSMLGHRHTVAVPLQQLACA